MPGMPIRRARKAAARQPPEPVSGSDGIQPAAPVAQASRARSVHDLKAQILRNAAAALDRVEQGLAKGMDARELKELTVSMNVLTRLSKHLEDTQPDEPMSPEQLAHELAEAKKLDAELKRRGEGG